MKKKQIIKLYNKYSWIINLIFALILFSKLYIEHFKINTYTISVFTSLILYIFYAIHIIQTHSKKVKFHIIIAKIGIILFHLFTIFVHEHQVIYFIFYIIFLSISLIYMHINKTKQKTND